jgi:hypothetical protein
MVKQMFGEINKMLTVSILVFVVVSIDFWIGKWKL